MDRIMARFTLFEATEFRQELQERFDIYTHFHDQCGGGFSFSYDEPLPADAREFIEDYFEERGMKVQFNGDNSSLILL